MTLPSRNALCSCGSGKKYKRCCGQGHATAQSGNSQRSPAEPVSAVRGFPSHERVILWLILAIGLFYLATIRRGHDWGGDNCQYLLHARNLLKGLPYAETGVIFNPDSSVFPKTYPPVFPLLLVPCYALFGIAFLPFKIMLIGVFLGTLGLFYQLYKQHLPFLLSCALLMLIGLNPLFWNYKDYILSEVPFIFFVCLVFFVKNRSDDAAGPRQRALYATLLGIACYLAYGTRSVGFLLLPALVLCDLARFRKIKLPTLGALAAFAPLMFFQNRLFHGESGHLRYKLVHLTGETALKNLTENYPKQFSFLWNYPNTSFLSVCMTALLCVLALVGFVSQLKKNRLSPADLWVVFYLIFFVTISFDDTTPPYRYFLPIFPFVITYAVLGLSRFRIGSFVLIKSVAAWVVVGFTLILYLLTYQVLQYGKIENSIDGPLERQLYDAIKRNTLPEDIVVFWDPRIITFYTGRRTSQHLAAKTKQEEMAYFRSIGAKYWVASFPFKDHYLRQLQLIYRNPKYLVYKFIGYD